MSRRRSLVYFYSKNACVLIALLFKIITSGSTYYFNVSLVIRLKRNLTFPHVIRNQVRRFLYILSKSIILNTLLILLIF